MLPGDDKIHRSTNPRHHNDEHTTRNWTEYVLNILFHNGINHVHMGTKGKECSCKVFNKPLDSIGNNQLVKLIPDSRAASHPNGDQPVKDGPEGVIFKTGICFRMFPFCNEIRYRLSY